MSELEPGDRDPGVGPAAERPLPWGRRARDVATVAWPSFLAACFATLLFFGQVDPELLGDTMSPSREISRMTGYGIGFFFFWLVALVSSVLTIYLVRTGTRGNGPDGG